MLNEAASFINAKRREDFENDPLARTLVLVYISPDGAVRVEVSGVGYFASEKQFISAIGERQRVLLDLILNRSGGVWGCNGNCRNRRRERWTLWSYSTIASPPEEERRMSEDSRIDRRPLDENQRNAIAELVTVSNNVAEARLATSDARFVIVTLSGKPTDDLNLQAELPRRAERILSALSSAGPKYAPLFGSFDSAWAAFRKAFGPKS